jgi:PAS domain S-box-containing protein
MDLILVAVAAAIVAGALAYFLRRRAIAEVGAARARAAALEAEIGDQRRLRTELEARERDMQVVADTMSAAVARCSADLRYLWVNRLYAEWAGNGRAPEDMIGRPMEEILGAEALEKMRPHLREVLSGRRVEYERYAARPKGRRWIRASLEPTFDASRKVTGWVAVIHDIDGSKRAAEALRGAQEQLEVILNTLPSGVCRTGNDLRFVWMNPVYAKWLGRPARQLVGQSVSEVLGDETMREIAPYLARVMKGEAVQYERLAAFPGLGRRWISVSFTPILDSHGNADGWVTVLTDVHDRRIAEESMREAERRKDDFLATLAHELRNPLAPIRNAVAILGRRGAPDPEVAWSREVIGRQVEQMSRLIDDLLDIERISRGKFLVRKERVSLERAIDMALEMSRPYVNAAGHRLSVLMPSGPVHVDADPARIAQVFSNLLNNAAKFTAPQGEIRLEAHLEAGEAVVVVEDSGIGFPPENASRLFRPYTQLAGASERGGGGGLGIGLSLVHGIVTLHGGRVEAHSDGPGRGAVFTVRLPLASDAAPAQPSTARQEEVPPPGLRVLVADDNKDAADSLERILSVYGYEVKVAYDGSAALDASLAFAPHFAILDIGMPGTNGYDVAREMRSRQGRNVTLVALTGWGQEADRRRSMEAGFDFHLTKPVDPQDLNDLLARVGKAAV